MQYTKILLHFNDSSNPWKDEAGNEWITSGGPTIQTTDAKFGSALRINNNYSCFIRNKNTIRFGDGDFTIDFWHKSYYVRQWGDLFSVTTRLDFPNEGDNPSLFDVQMSSYSGNIQIHRPELNQSNVLQVNVNPSQLHHYAIVYNSSLKTLSVYVDGKLNSSGPFTVRAIDGYFCIGNDMSNGQENNNSALFDEFRYSTCQRWTSDFTPPAQQYIYGPYAQFPSTRFGTYDKSPNGLTYKYRVRFEQGPYTQTSNVVNYVTEWGTEDDNNYTNTFSTKSKTFDATTATNSVQTLSQLADAEIAALQAKLDTYIGPFTTPSGRKCESTGFKANNGTTYFWETTVDATSNNTSLTATQALIKITTRWGTAANTLSTNGTTYINTSIKDDNTARNAYTTASSGTTTYIVKPNNFAQLSNIVKEILDKHEQGVKQLLNTYIGNVSNLDDVKTSITSAGENYYAKVTRIGTNTVATATKCTMTLTLTWSKGSESYSSSFSGGTAQVDIVSTNYQTRDAVTKTQADALIEKWKAYVKTLFGTVDKPTSKTHTWQTSTGNVWVQMDFTLGTKSESAQVINTVLKYSLVNSTCNTAYKNGILTINSSNYVTRATEYETHFQKLLAEFKNDYSFLNSAPPEAKTMNYQAVNGITYTYKFVWTYSNTRDLTQAVYKLTTTYGESSSTATANTYKNTTTLNITQQNASYNIRMAAFDEATATEETQLKAFLDTLVIKVTAPTAITKSHVATNGITYAYRVSCSVTPVDGTQSNVTIKSEWGKTTTYGNEFATSTFTLTAVNQSVFEETANRLMTAHETKLQGFLNTLIDNVTFNGKSGQNLASNGAYYYYRTNVTGISTNDMSPKEYITANGGIE